LNDNRWDNDVRKLLFWQRIIRKYTGDTDKYRHDINAGFVVDTPARGFKFFEFAHFFWDYLPDIQPPVMA
jgi:hypothetical protein